MDLQAHLARDIPQRESMRQLVRRAIIAALAAGGGSLAVYQAVNPIFEGQRYTAYLDIVGVPTICEGWTHGVKLGDTATPEKCAVYSREAHDEAKRIFDRWVPQHVRDRLGPVNTAAFLLFITNVGPGGKGVKDGFVWLKSGRHSSMLLHLQAGNIDAACSQFRHWANAGGKRVHGLEIRRVDEAGMCWWPK